MRLIIFDFDGTLADTFSGIAASLNAARSAIDLPPVEPDQIRRWIGYGLRHFMVNALPGESHDEASIEHFTKTYKAIYARDAIHRARLFDGMLEVLDAVSGEVLVLASNKSEEQLVPMVERLGIRDRFVAIVGGNTTDVKKPDPKLLEHILERVPVAIESTWMVGDSEPDIEFGSAIGARSIGCLWGLRERADLEAAGADFLVESPEDLLRVLAAN